MILVKKFPAEEKYSLTDDMRRASRSITHNIAEGFGRYHLNDNTRFCRYTRGSLNELTDQFITALDENYITREEYDKGRNLVDNSIRLVNGYVNYLKRANDSKNIVSEEEITYTVSDPQQQITDN